MSREAAGPLQNEMRKLRADKDALELVNDQLANDVGYWRDRCVLGCEWCSK